MENLQEQYIARRLERDEQLLGRALGDADFRQELIDHPHTSLSSLYRVAIPENADIRVFEERSNSHYMVIPPDMTRIAEELTDEQLEAVAGGWFLQLAWTTICVGSGKPGGT